MLAAALGDHIFEHYMAAKRQEWADYISHVHPPHPLAPEGRNLTPSPPGVSPFQGEPEGALETWGSPCVAALLVRPQAI